MENWEYTYSLMKTHVENLVRKKTTPEDVMTLVTNDAWTIMTMLMEDPVIKKKIQTVKLDYPTKEAFIDHLVEKHQKVLKAYEAYKQRRTEGSPREFFRDYNAAKWYLLQTSPIRLIDGYWLAKAESVEKGSEHLKKSLVRVYMDEMGAYEAVNLNIISLDNRNTHANVYSRLLNGLFQDNHTSWIHHSLIKTSNASKKDIFQQGVFQLSLAILSSEFYDELVGFTLGYEQIAEHLLITNHELQELGMDSKYFQLHLTVDNVHTGHAALMNTSVLHDQSLSYERLLLGYMISDSMLEVKALMKHYDLDKQVENILSSKSRVSYSMHSSQGNLSQIMKECNGEALVAWLKNQKYFEGSTFTETRFCQLLQAKMQGAFTLDEIDFLEVWHQTKGPVVNELQDDDILRSMLLRSQHKHGHVKVGNSDLKTLTEHNLEDLIKLLKTDTKLQERVQNSFSKGQMKKVALSHTERECMKRFCGFSPRNDL